DARAILVADRQVEHEIAVDAQAESGEARGVAAAFASRTPHARDGGHVPDGRLASSTITASTSNSAPRGRLATPTVERAGYGASNHFCIASFTFAKFARSVRNS